ncbi:MAG: InlB B-repeat-containing protein [Clostridia bacterium]|nr:InlB B-repeat-containing protein [Clostridia bacterium]
MKKFKNLFLIAFILINAVLVSSFITISKPNEVFAVGSTHTVTFKANGGVGNDYTQIFNDYETQNLTPNTFTREGYVFASWNDNIDGLGLTHYDCDGLTLAGSDLTLYAQWAEKFIITFNENGGSEVSDFNEPEGISITEPAEPTKTGYTFAGWFTDNTTFEEEFTFDTMPSENVTLFAQWTVNTYTIIFVTNGGVEV